MYQLPLRREEMIPPSPAPVAQRVISASMRMPASTGDKPFCNWKRCGRKTIVIIKGKPAMKAVVHHLCLSLDQHVHDEEDWKECFNSHKAKP